jgi:hypothetical protein
MPGLRTDGNVPPGMFLTASDNYGRRDDRRTGPTDVAS